MNSIIGSDDRDDILKLISGIGHAKIGTIDIGVIYDTKQMLEIKNIYDAEIEDIIENLFLQHVDMKSSALWLCDANWEDISGYEIWGYGRGDNPGKTYISIQRLEKS